MSLGAPFGFGPVGPVQMRPEDLARLFQGTPLGAPQGFGGSSGTIMPPVAMNEAQTRILEQSTGMSPPAQPPAFGFGPLPPMRPSDDDLQAGPAPGSPGGPSLRPHSLEGTGSVDMSMRAGAPGVAPTSRPPSAFGSTPLADRAAPGMTPAVGQAPGGLGSPAAGAPADGPSPWMSAWKQIGDSGIGDQMIAMSAGLLSKGGAAGWAKGFENMQKAGQVQALLDQQRGEYGLKRAKLARELGGDNQTVQLLIRRGHAPDDAQAMVAAAAAGNTTALNNALNNAVPKAPNDYQLDPATRRAMPIEGGPQDLRTMEAEALAKARGAAAGKPDEDVTLSPGQVRISGSTGQPIVSVPDRDKAMERAGGIRKEIQSLPSYKNYTQALPIYQGMTETAGRDSKASDLNLIYGLGKIMDPGSVVREGELQMARDTQGAADKLIGMYNSIAGGARLSPQARQQLLTEAYGRLQSYENAFGQDRRGYEGIVGRSGLHPDDVLPNFTPAKPYQAAPKPNRADLEAEARRRGLMQ